MNKPLILDFAIPRIRDGNKQFSYDYSKDLNIINVDGLPIIFIESDININEAQTETRVDRERDDEENISMAELISKTYADRERDDEDDFIIN